MKIFDDTLATLERSLDVRAEKHDVLTGDLANADTPQFIPKDIDFDAAMKSYGDGGPRDPVRTQPMHIAPNDGRVELPVETDAMRTTPGLDGNEVDLDRTMAQLAENGLSYGASSRAVGKKLAILRYVVSDGLG